jgi:DNA-binding FadR family transcriptional regulator
VANQIGRAIELGILPEGEQLPAEAEFASQMGVSTMTLREAFAILRGQGLVETRRGRTGGTFVRHAPEPKTDQLWQRLAETSVTGLRDLTDAQFATEGTAAFCAAERAPQMAVRRLFTLIDQMAAAATLSDLIRADSRFNIEVAIASQSERLLRRVVELQTESGDLLWTPYNDAYTPQMAIGEHREIAESIAAGDAELARTRAQHHVQGTLAHLIDLHRAAGHAARTRRRTSAAPATAVNVGTVEPLLREVRALLEGVFTSIDGLVVAFHALRSALDADPASHDLHHLDGAVRAVIEQHEMAEGAGYIYAPGYIDGHDRYTQWMHVAHDRIAPLRFNLDTASVNLYDYLEMDWYTIARDRDSRCVYGPFLDYTGADYYVVTLTVPLSHDGQFLGVAGADLRMADLERRLMAIVDAAPGDAVLINSERTVLAANTPQWVAGSRLHATPEVGAETGASTADGTATVFTEVHLVSDESGWLFALSTPARPTAN